MFASPIRKLTNKSTAASMIPSSAFYLDFSETQASAMSPTLEAKHFAGTGHHFLHDKNSRADSKKLLETINHPWEVIDSKSVGLKILDALSNEKSEKKSSKMDNRMVLFGSQLRVQIPSTSKSSSFRTATVDSPQSLIEFGVKNKTSKLSVALLPPARKSSSPTLCLSASEMELSEDYTRVVSHGPNPKTTHIFDTCVMEDSSIGFNSMRREMKFSVDESNGYHSDDFLAFCDACRKKLGQGKDIFMYRGEQAFCSHECRSKQMLADNELENSAHCGRTDVFYQF